MSRISLSLSLLDVLTSKKQVYTADDVPSFKVIAAFECRGMSVIDFQFGVSWARDLCGTVVVFLIYTPHTPNISLLELNCLG